MSRSSNPARIGLFVLAGLALAVGTLIYVGSVRLFDREETFLIYFKESVNGLSVGSPVKFKGVTIGSVSDIRLSYNQDDSIEESYIPVFIRISGDKVSGNGEGSQSVDLSDWNEFSRLIRKGLRGRLQLESIITGQLFIELDFIAEPGADFRVIQHQIEYREIPSTPSVMAEIGSSTADVLAKLGAIDVKGFSDKINMLLDNANDALIELDVGAMNETVVGVGERIEHLLADVDLRTSLERFNELLVRVDGFVEKLDGATPTLFEDLAAISDELNAAIGEGRALMGNLKGVVAPEASLHRELVTTLRDVRTAARAARELMNFLERNPGALLSGRSDASFTEGTR